MRRKTFGLLAATAAAVATMVTALPSASGVATATHPTSYPWTPSASRTGLPGVWELDDTHSGHALSLVFQGSDGNLVEYVDGHAVWSSRTSHVGAATLNFQGGDGNVVIRNAAGKALYASGAAYSASIRPTVDHVTILPNVCTDGTERFAGVMYFNDGTAPQWVPQLMPARGPGC